MKLISSNILGGMTPTPCILCGKVVMTALHTAYGYLYVHKEHTDAELNNYVKEKKV